MPSYLTPGVYVEEIPAQSKPIEGVGTSVAAFVGIAPGGPVNRPMRISNWTQFAKLYGDPTEPENGPFMPGAYLAHSVYGFFQNGGGVCWIVRVGGADGGQQAQAALPAASGDGRRALPRDGARRRHRPGVDRDHARGAGRGGDGEEGKAEAGHLPRRRHRRPAARGVRRPDAQEGPPEHRHQGERGLGAGHARGGQRRVRRGRPARGHLHAERAGRRAGGRRPDRVRGRRRPPPRAGRPGGGRRDHDAVHPRPGDDRPERRRHHVPRHPGQDDRPRRGGQGPDRDPRPAARPAAAGRARVAHVDGRLRLEVRHALLPVARGDGPAHAAADHGAAVRPHGRRVGAHRQHPRRAQGARPTRSCWA